MALVLIYCFVIFFNVPASTEIYTLSLHDALPILGVRLGPHALLGLAERVGGDRDGLAPEQRRSEEHTSELQSPDHLVCRLLLEKKKKTDKVASASIIIVIVFALGMYGRES